MQIIWDKFIVFGNMAASFQMNTFDNRIGLTIEKIVEKGFIFSCIKFYRYIKSTDTNKLRISFIKDQF